MAGAQFPGQQIQNAAEGLRAGVAVFGGPTEPGLVPPSTYRRLAAEYQRAKKAGRTGQTLEEWRADAITQQAVAWVLARCWPAPTSCRRALCGSSRAA